MVALVVAAAVAGAGCGGGGGGGDTTTATSAGDAAPAIRQTVLGRGAQAVTILEPAGQRPGPRPVVVFLHGWGAIAPESYGAWLAHLIGEGNTVVYPRYQTSTASPPDRVLATTLTALRLAFRRVPPATGSLVVAGHSAGGALSADYAARARGAGLPVPAAIFAAYPGRSASSIDGSIPEVDPAGVPDDVRVLALGGARDEVVGTAVARRIGQLGRFVLVRDRRVDTHLGPLQADPAARQAFWAPLDRLIQAARG